jgi:hypothetical protein
MMQTYHTIQPYFIDVDRSFSAVIIGRSHRFATFVSSPVRIRRRFCMARHPRAWLSLVFLFAAALPPAPAVAQTTTATVQGTVTDTSRAVLPGAIVTLAS